MDVLDNSDENNFPIEVNKMNEETYAIQDFFHARCRRGLS